jgi:hypothetical protein
VRDIPPELAAPVKAMQDLAAGAPQSAEGVAAFFARFVIGLDLDAVRGPFAILDELHGQVGALGGGLTNLAARVSALTAAVDKAAEDLVGAAPDHAAIVASLNGLKAGFDDLTGAALPAAMEKLAGDLAAIDPGALAKRLDDSLAPLVAHIPVPPRDLADFVLSPIRSIAADVDTLTTQALTDTFTAIEQQIHDMFAASDVAVLRDAAAELLLGLTQFLDGLPLAALRNKLTQALLGIEGKIRHLADFSPVHDIAAKVQTITDGIDKIDLSSVTGRIAALKDQLQHVADGFPIHQIKDELGSLLTAANNAAASLPPLIDGLKQEIDALAEQVTHINLDQAAQQSVGLLHEVRGHVKDALGSGDIPDALKAPIGVLAGEVRKIDVTVSIDKPLNDLVAKIDVTAVLAPVQKGVDEAKSALQKLSPQAMITALDKPFNDMVAALETISPAALIGQLSAGFKSAAGQIDHLDPRALIQPLQAEFDKLLGALRKAADPAPLLAPLNAAYHDLQGVLDAANPSQLIGKAVAQISQLPGTISGAAMSAVSAKSGSGAIPAMATSGAFKFGDIIRPLLFLMAEARAVVHSAEAGVIADGLDHIARPLALLIRAGGVAGGHVAEVGALIEAHCGIVDPTAAAGPMPELRHALERLARLEGMLADDGRSSAELSASVQSLQLDAHITASVPHSEKVTSAALALTSGLQTPAIGRGFQALGRTFANVVPDALTFPDTQAAIVARLDAVFDAVDLQPVAAELDTLGDKIIAKFESFATDIAKLLMRLWNAVFDNLNPVTPQGFLDLVSKVFDAVRAQLALLDPARLAAELGGLLDATVGVLEAYSPAAFAATLGGAFDALKAKLAALDPAALLGDLNPLQGVIDQFKALKPSVVLAPLAAQAQAVDAALAHLLDLDLAKIMTDAIANLKLQIESVIHQIEAELDGLLGDLQAGGSVSATVSA